MTRIFFYIAFIVLVLAGSYVIFDRYFDIEADGPSDAAVNLFQEELHSRAIESLDAQPIEGFDADILMEAFPGLTESDFDGVRSLEGVYVYDKELRHERIEGKPQTSAERTVSHEGYRTLLENTYGRLGINVMNRDTVKLLVEILQTHDTRSPDRDTIMF